MAASSRVHMVNVDITARGEVSEHARRLAREKVGSLERAVRGPFLAAHVVLTEASNPRKSDHARAEAEIDLQGRLIRAHASAPSMEAAVDAVTKRLQQQLRRHVERLITPIALETAIAEMNVVHHRSLFVENAANRRGNIIYRSNDGNYGLIEPA